MLYRLRAAQKVLGLADKHNSGRLEAACAKAITVGDPTYKTVEGILVAGTETDQAEAPTGNAGAAAYLHGPEALLGDNVIPLPVDNDDHHDAADRRGSEQEVVS